MSAKQFALVLILTLGLTPAARPAGPPAWYLPDDTEIVLGIEVGPFLDSPTGKHYLPQLLQKTVALVTNSSAKETEQGIDGLLKLLAVGEPAGALKDTLRRVLVAGPFDGAENGLLWTIEGNFNAAKFGEFAQQVATKQPFGVTLDPKKPGARDICSLKWRGGETIYLALADEHRLFLSGVKQRVEDALAGKEASSKTVAQLRELLDKVDRRQPVWLKAVLAKDANLETVQGHALLDGGLRVEMRVLTRGTKIASRLEEQIGDELKKLPAQADWPQSLGLQLLKRTKVKTRDAELTLSAALGDEDLKELLVGN